MSNLSTAFDTFLGLPGLRGFWPLSSFDESGNAYDVSGWGGTLTRNGNPTYDVNPQGTGYLDLDGTGDYLSFADHAHFDILGTESYVAGAAQGLTLGGWFWIDTVVLSGLIGKYNATGNQKAYLLSASSAQTTASVSSGGSVEFIVAGAALSTGAWHFVVMRFDPSTELAIFVDKAKTVNTTSIPASIFNSTAAFQIGAISGASVLNGRAALCFACAEVVSDALLDDLFDASEPLFSDTVSKAETVTLSETVSRVLVSQPKPAETVNLTEAVSRILVSQPKPAETVTLTEAVSGLLTSYPRPAETVTLTEAQSLTVGTPQVSQSETVTLTEAQSVLAVSRIGAAETVTLSESGTTVLLVSIVGQSETVTLSEGVTVRTALSATAAETVTLTEGVLVNTGTSLLISQAETITLTEGVSAARWETVSIILYDTLGLTDVAEGPVFSLTDTLALSDELVGKNLADTLTLTDDVTIGNVTLTLSDTLTFSEVLVLDGPTIPPPATAATSELDYNPVLKLLYGNDKRNPVRELDLAQLAPGSIHLMAGGFAPGAGERNELWSGESIRFSGQKKLAESRKNSQLAVTCVLKTGGSQAALSYFQRKIARFFDEAKQHQLLGQNHTVWLEYRWSDGMPDLATPTFGQLSNYYEVYSATAPKWPDSLHDDLQSLTQGQIADVLLNITGSPTPEGLRQPVAVAGGTVTLEDKGVLIASGASSRLHWITYSNSGLTGNFTVTGWITLNATWGSGTKYVFDYYVSASNRISIAYNATANYWTITKIVSGSTFTANSSSDAVANGDDVHLILVQESTTLRLYVNGVQAASVIATNTMTDGGWIGLGCPITTPYDGVDVILDGWRIMPDDITSTYALALYESELPIKQDGGQVGPPPYFWTSGGDGAFDNVDDASRDNWGIIGGIGGDLEAAVEYQFTVPTVTPSRLYWVGRKAADELLASNILWYDFSGTADAGSSGGAYQEVNTNFARAYGATLASGIDQTRGRYLALTRFISTIGSFDCNLRPFYHYAGDTSRVYGKTTYVNTTLNFCLYELGDLILDWFGGSIEPPSLTVGLLATPTGSATGTTTRLDFLALLPWPYGRAEITELAPSLVSGDRLVIEGQRAYILTATGGYKYICEYQGAEVTALPHKYNYIHFAQAEYTAVGEGEQTYSITKTATLAAFVTPRYLLPGGMVA